MSEKKKTKKAAVSRRKNHEVSANNVEWIDVDSDRTSLGILLEPPAPRIELPAEKETAVVQTPEARQVSLRQPAVVKREKSSPIIPLSNMDDYARHVLQNPHQVHVIRFSAPWCQVCRTTNVAWERMASRINKTSSADRSVQFLSVVVDGKNDEVKALQDMLQIDKVPQGVVHHPTKGIFGARIDMSRKNLGRLKKNLERFCTLTRDEDGLQSGMLMDGLRD